ncbi:CD166 antigen-like isoform X2 [Ptychodera flava]|uniref:CD166 antigen-like isoform X2 n=1 Tax=Ptychodera flava TaxID=63121 RepID=UPI003969E802
MVDKRLNGIWLYIPVLSAISAASIVEGPADTLGIVGYNAQLNCTVGDTTGDPVMWDCLECTTPLTVGEASIYPDKYDVIFVDGPLKSYHLRVFNTTTDEEDTYHCTIAMSNKASANLTILTSGPSCVVTPSMFVIEDNEATLTCAVEKGVPPGELVWYREGLAVSKEDTSTRHELKLVFTREDNGTSFTCTLEDETLPPQTEDLMTCADDVVIIVQYKCAVAMTLEPVNSIVEGDDVTIHCLSHDGYPDPYTMGLTFNNETIIEVNDTEINYTIENISLNQSGTYECFAVTRFYDDSEQHSTAQHDIIVNLYADVPVNLGLILGVVAAVISVTLVSLLIVYLVLMKKKHGSKVKDSPKEIPQGITDELHHDDATENAQNETQVTSKESDAAEVEWNGGQGLTKLDGDTEPEAARQQRPKRRKKRKRGGSNRAYDSAKTIPVPLDGSVPQTEDDHDGSEHAQDVKNASPPLDGSIPHAEDDGSEHAQDVSFTIRPFKENSLFAVL